MANFVVDKMENFVEREENAGYQHFLLFPQCFQKTALSSESLKVGIVWLRVKFVCLGFNAVSTVFQLSNGDSSQIQVSWTIFDQYLTGPLS